MAPIANSARLTDFWAFVSCRLGSCKLLPRVAILGCLCEYRTGWALACLWQQFCSLKAAQIANAVLPGKQCTALCDSVSRLIATCPSSPMMPSRDTPACLLLVMAYWKTRPPRSPELQSSAEIRLHHAKDRHSHSAGAKLRPSVMRETPHVMQG